MIDIFAKTAESAPVIKGFFDPLQSVAAWHCGGRGIKLAFTFFKTRKSITFELIDTEIESSRFYNLMSRVI